MHYCQKIDFSTGEVLAFYMGASDADALRSGLLNLDPFFLT